MNQSFRSSSNIWLERVRRKTRRLRLTGADIARAFRWYIGGGRRFFNRYSEQLLATHKWCFIVGCNNSGTSLLQDVLERTGQVSTFPLEGQVYTTALMRSNRQRFPRIWSEYLDDMRLTEDDRLTCVTRLLHDWMGTLRLPLREIIVEKTPANAVRMRWLQKAFPHCCFIGLIRNGYAVAEGIQRKSNQPVERGAQHWNIVNRIMVEDAKHIKHYLELRYEDLVDRPAESAKRLAQFIGLDCTKLERAMGEQYAFETVRGHNSNHIMNLNWDSIQRLSVEERRRICAEANEMLDYFGYTPTTE